MCFEAEGHEANQFLKFGGLDFDDGSFGQFTVLPAFLSLLDLAFQFLDLVLQPFVLFLQLTAFLTGDQSIVLGGDRFGLHVVLVLALERHPLGVELVLLRRGLLDESRGGDGVTCS